MANLLFVYREIVGEFAIGSVVAVGSGAGVPQFQSALAAHLPPARHVPVAFHYRRDGAGFGAVGARAAPRVRGVQVNDLYMNIIIFIFLFFLNMFKIKTHY